MSQNKRYNISTVIITVFLTIIIVGFGAEKFSSKKSGDDAAYKPSSDSLSKFLVGKPAPSFSLADREGTVYNNDSLKGKRVVLFFNEGLICYPACWNQMLEFPRDKRFTQDDVAVFSVVVDTKNSWLKAIEKMPELGNVKVLFDNEKNVSKNFQMLSAPSSMHAGNIPGHTYVVIDREGIVRYVLDDPRMAINNGAIYYEIEKLK